VLLWGRGVLLRLLKLKPRRQIVMRWRVEGACVLTRPPPCRCVIGELEAIEQQQDPMLASPRDVYIDLDMAIHQLERAMSSMRKAWWP
jgi:hypothetical protein